MKKLFSLLICICFLLTNETRLFARITAVDHPFMLWTPSEAATIRQKVKTVPWMQKAYRDLLNNSGGDDRMSLLFRYGVMGDELAGITLKKDLFDVINSRIPLGGAMEFQILAYDLLYNSLTKMEKDLVESKFREYIAYSIPPGSVTNTNLFNDEPNIQGRFSRYDAKDNIYTRTNWLPNIIFPRKITANLMALALRDENLIRDTWAVHGSLKYYFDEYLADKGFYMEEFSKMTSTPGSLLFYCIAAKNLGLNELGFGYVGKGGATVRGHIETILDLTFPKIDLGTSRPQWPQITAGDLRDYPPFQHATIKGYFADGTGGNPQWVQAGAWGGPKRGRSRQWDSDVSWKTRKMTVRLWFELAYKLWPDMKTAYFLAQMRGLGEQMYYPSLYFGLEPIDPGKVQPPVAPSAIWKERGIVMLRHDESPAYWESKAPAVAMRLATNYAHNVYDAFAIIGFFSLNKPFYMNPHINPSYAKGYSASIKSHCAVSIDCNKSAKTRTGTLEPKFTDLVTTRQGFHKNVKFVAAHTSDRYKGVDETKSLFLTKEYLFEVSDEKSDSNHVYLWTIYAIGEDDNLKGWKSTTDLSGFIKELSNEFSSEGNQGWSVIVRQKPFNGNLSSMLSKGWFTNNPGIKITMLGYPGMKAYVADAPKPEMKDEAILNLTTVLSKVEDKNVQFLALHEPFENEPKINDFKLIQKTKEGVAVSIKGRDGEAVNDRLMLRLGLKTDQLMTLAGGGDSFSFSDYAFVRISKDTVNVNGNISSLKVKVEGKPKLIINDKIVESSISGGVLSYFKKDL